MRPSAAEHADAVIVGAGIIGLSIGFHLLQADPTHRVIIVEQADRPGSGSTAKATGGIRHQFAAPALVRLSQHSVREYRAFATLTGVDVEFEEVGYLLFTTTAGGAARLRAAVEVQRMCGVDVMQMPGSEVTEHWRYLGVDGVQLAVHTPHDGHANPYAAMTGYLQAFRRMGGRVIMGEPVTGLLQEADRIIGVRTPQREISAGVVVNAAGVFAADVAAMAGGDLPVHSYRRQIAVLTELDLDQSPLPFTMHTDSGWYLHRLTDGVLLIGGIDKDTHPGREETVDPDVTVRLVEIGLRLIPALAGASLVRSYAGVRALTPDDLPVLGPVPTVRGLYCACGLAGHGFMHAPAVGDALARWILTGHPGIPGLEACLPDRFLGGAR